VRRPYASRVPFAGPLLLLLAACAGNATGGPISLLLAHGAPAPSEPAVVSAEGGLVVVAGTVPVDTACADLQGRYEQDETQLDVTLERVPRKPACDAADPVPVPYLTRFGPLAPGVYRVNVRLDDSTVLTGAAVELLGG
jgi:hypothetical protein